MDIKKPYPVNKKLKGFASNLRKNQTTEERKLWYDYLNKVTPRFHRQGVIDNYIVDFYCPKLRIVIEIDGFQHYFKDAFEYDEKRTENLEKIGFVVLRFDNEDVNRNFDYVVLKIQELCIQRANVMNIESYDFSLK